MQKTSKRLILIALIFTSITNCLAQKEEKIIDEVIWVVGDNAVLRSDIEAIIEDARVRKISLPDNPFCTLPEQIAVEKLYLHQASIDSLEVNDAGIQQAVDNDINSYISNVGSVAKAEEYLKKTISELRKEMYERYKNQNLVQQMQMKLVESIEATPTEIRKFYNESNPDSFPTISEKLEVQVLSIKPPIPTEDVEKIKKKLRDYTERAKNKPEEFAFLARLYSEDQGSALRGGELGFAGRGKYDPAFADVAFSLQRPNQISRVVESQYGFHIIQLLERRGDKSNFRHILLRPKASEEVKLKGVFRLDSLANAIREQKVTFDEAVFNFSDDKDTKLNNGLMMRVDQYTRSLTSHFEYKDLPPKIAEKAYSMKIGEISDAFTMIDASTGKEMIAIIKLKSKTPSHKANPKDDYQLLKMMLEEKKKNEYLKSWIAKKQKETYIVIDPKYRNCDFQYKGWVKE